MTTKQQTLPRLEDLTLDEIDAILHHKWLLSERQGRDVGMEAAVKDFFDNHGYTWRKKEMEEDHLLQRQEILKHKWYLSEKYGYDVGSTAAALDWIRTGYAEHWRNKTGPYAKLKS